MKKIIIGNKNRPNVQLSAGLGEPTRILSSIGLSPGVTNIETELKKARIAVEAGADIINDDSVVEPDGSKLRKLLYSEFSVPVNTEPIFSTSAQAFYERQNILDFDESDLLSTIKQHSEEGSDILTLHFAYSRKLAEKMANSNRIIPLTSRGGAIITRYMIEHGEENPYQKLRGKILDIVKKNNVTISLGTVLRPGSIVDGFDNLFIEELIEQRKFIKECWDLGIGVMVEGAGHIPLEQMQNYMSISKKIIMDAPYRSLGPTLCDCGAGYDHITGAIGAAVASMYGCDFITCTTKGEHVGLPRLKDVEEAVKAFKIAVYIGRSGKTSRYHLDRKISEARNLCLKEKIWKNSLFSNDVQSLDPQLNKNNIKTCSVCGPYCALKINLNNIRSMKKLE
ncbi:phosphomethylpyrimidine synthase ThiC [Promethearchaeum syntrophicum]|uniref:Phosphomethylpyrimidine synthase ThiC n=1 Tax=Promethearchaeum syntrophicum TaxID=2594042 RepID=A0A5B9D799_9ARCH|nr:phosphomethylpyrimidine synthase ThiC [Candidatus Prometheoarchaeum syntrophicum]QEE14895.1 thiamine biosynthesis protein ThiC [Candidatus Prometheoarchaeum syntrophicum]